MKGPNYEKMKTKDFFLNVKEWKGPILSEIQNKPKDLSGTTVKSIFYNVPNLFQYMKMPSKSITKRSKKSFRTYWF